MYKLESLSEVRCVLAALDCKIEKFRFQPLLVTRRVRDSIHDFVREEENKKRYCRCKPRCARCGRLQKGTTVVPRGTILF